MRTLTAVSAATMLCASLLAGCGQKTEDAAANTAAATESAATATASDASATVNSTAGAGGAVSGPEANGAINPDANRSQTEVAAASNSFTEGQARGHIENAGYTDVSGLTKSPDGLWTGMAKKGGKAVSVAVDFKGAVTTR
jgi:hypothetical protein